ncbi:cytochrome b/b6 domain-containing protein [Roseibium sp. M-1]
MMTARTPKIGRWLHWTVAALVLAALATGYALTNSGMFSLNLLRAHLVLGAAAGLLALFRVIQWIARGAPAPVFKPLSRTQAAAAALVHAVLRLIPLLLLVSGAGMILISGILPFIIFGGLTGLTDLAPLPPRNLHHAAAFVLAVLTGIHTLAALWHIFRRPSGGLA